MGVPPLLETPKWTNLYHNYVKWTQVRLPEFWMPTVNVPGPSGQRCRIRCNGVPSHTKRKLSEKFGEIRGKMKIFGLNKVWFYKVKFILVRWITQAEPAWSSNSLNRASLFQNWAHDNRMYHKTAEQPWARHGICNRHGGRKCQELAAFPQQRLARNRKKEWLPYTLYI